MLVLKDNARIIIIRNLNVHVCSLFRTSFVPSRLLGSALVLPKYSKSFTGFSAQYLGPYPNDQALAQPQWS